MDNSTPIESSQLPVIAGHEITTDEHGRFNLNAIHRASEAGQTKRPSIWKETKQAQELISELDDQSQNSGLASLESSKGGKSPGTFAHELLAVSYAGWISPRFQLQVNQVFLDYRMGKLKETEGQRALPNPLTPSHQRELQKAIAARVYAQVPKEQRPAAFKKLYGHLKDRFSVAKYDQIEDSRYTEALGAVQSFELEGDFLPIEEKPAAEFSDEDLSDIYILLCHVHWIHRHWNDYRIEEALRMLQSPAGSQICEHMGMANTFKTRLTKAKGELLEASRKRLGLNYGLIPIY